MKRLFVVLVLCFLIAGCSKDDSSPGPSFVFESMAVNDVQVPEEFVFGQTYTISMFYRVPSTCYSFHTIVIEEEGNQKTMTILNSVLTNVLCEPYDNVTSEASFDLNVNSYEPYVFRFWKGKDINGQDDYYIVEVPVRR